MIKLLECLLASLQKFESVSPENRVILKSFNEYMQSKDLKGEHYIANLLLLLISFDKFLCKDGLNQDFTSINSREQFLNHRQVKGKWVERVKDAGGKFISTFNLKVSAKY